MAFGTASKIFAYTIKDILDATAVFDFDANQFKVALFNNTITAPDNTVVAASTAFGAGVWAANEVFDAAEWPTGGEILGGGAEVDADITVSTTTITWDAGDTVSTGTSATLADVRGCLVYNDTLASPVADQGVCFNSFGGANAVTDGTFTIVWSASGILSISVA